MADIVGIMGGTFNPVHKGHIAIAKAAHEQFNISQILVKACHKQLQLYVSFNIRDRTGWKNIYC